LPSDSEYIVSGLSRKVALLHGRLAIGWSGYKDAAKAVIGNIKTAMERDNISYDDLMRLLDSPNYIPKGKLSLCGMMIEESDIKMFHRGGKHFHAEGCGDILTVGSGTDHFFEIVRSTNVHSIVQRNLPLATCAVASCVGIALGEQMRLRSGLDLYYGGGFEILTLDNGKISPIEITFLFIDVSRTAHSINMTFHAILKTGYRNDVLIVRKASLINFGTEVQMPNEVYILSPFYRSVESAEVDAIKQNKIPLGSRFTGTYVHFTGADPQKVPVWFLMNDSHSDPAVQVVESESEAEIHFSPALIERICTKARAVYKDANG
jgi:hypothetical protein